MTRISQASREDSDSSVAAGVSDRAADVPHYAFAAIANRHSGRLLERITPNNQSEQISKTTTSRLSSHASADPILQTASFMSHFPFPSNPPADQRSPSIADAVGFAFSVQRWFVDLLEVQVFDGRIDKAYRTINASQVSQLNQACASANAIHDLWSTAWDGTAEPAQWHCSRIDEASLLGMAMHRALASPFDFGRDADFENAPAGSVPEDFAFRALLLAELGLLLFEHIRAEAAEVLAAGGAMDDLKVAYILAMTDAFIGMMYEVQNNRLRADSDEDLETLLDALQSHLDSSRMELGGPQATSLMEQLMWESVSMAMDVFPGRRLESFLRQQEPLDSEVTH